MGALGTALGLTNKKGAAFSVTLEKVIDPAKGKHSSASSATSRFVGVQFTIDNTSAKTISPKARADVIAIGANGHVFVPGRKRLASCSSFPRRHFKIAPGTSISGCLEFEIPTSTSIAKVEFLPTGGRAGNFGEWLNS